jgi:hypothetical protein
MTMETTPDRQYRDEFKLEPLPLAELVGLDQAAK